MDLNGTEVTTTYTAKGTIGPDGKVKWNDKANLTTTLSSPMKPIIGNDKPVVNDSKPAIGNEKPSANIAKPVVQ